MARNVYISFCHEDERIYKEELAELFDLSQDTMDFSEDKDRSNMNGFNYTELFV